MPAKPTAKDALVARIERFIKKNRMTATAFGRDAIKDPSLMRELRAGRSVGLDTAERIEQFMKGYAQ